MPRMTIYIPKQLHAEVISKDMNVSRICRAALARAIGFDLRTDMERDIEERVFERVIERVAESK